MNQEKNNIFSIKSRARRRLPWEGGRRLEFKKPFMTVCIAVLTQGEDYSGDFGIVCASDRMLTSNYTEYEAFESKAFQPIPGVVVLLSGVMQIHAEATGRLLKEVELRPSTTVKEIAELYAEQIRRLRSEWAAYEFLSPFGLTQETFLEKQQTMSPAEVSRLSQEISNYAFNIEAIVAGIDDDGPHLFQIDGKGFSTCQTENGVAAIGIGADHATLQLILARYSKAHATNGVALALLYAAKKSAELAPGVGKATDMFRLGKDGLFAYSEEILRVLQSTYEKWEKELSHARGRAVLSVTGALASTKEHDIMIPFRETVAPTRRAESA